MVQYFINLHMLSDLYSVVPIIVTKKVDSDDVDAKKYIGKTVFGISGYPLGILEEVRFIESTGSQEFWVRNHYGLIQFYYFCLRPEDCE